MPKTSKKLSSIMSWLFILLSYVPMLTIFALKDESRIFTYAVTFFWITVIALLRMPSIDLSMLKRSSTIRNILFIAISVLVFLIIYKYLGFSLNFNISRVYEIRASFSKLNVPLAGYLFTWAGYVVNPLFFALFFYKRKWLLTLIIVFMQLFLFSSTGNKTFLFTLFFVSALMWITTRKNPFAYMATGLTGIVIAGMLSFWLIGDLWVSSLFTRRVLLDQPQQYFFYFDFFSNNDFTFLSQHHLFNLFFDYKYPLDPPNLIGKVYYGSPDNNANTGLVGDAYMNFGFAGIALWGFVLVMILKLVDTFSNGKHKMISIAAVSMPTFTLINSALLTNLLTHGLLLALLLLYLLPGIKNVTHFYKKDNYIRV